MMNKAMVIILFIASVIAVIFLSTACAKVGEPYHDSSRMVVAEKDGYWTILYDRKTMVMYMSVQLDSRYGLTVMLDADGKPLLYEE